MGLEATSWDWLRDGIMKTLPNFALLERMENGVNIGTADVNYLIRGVEGWLELKAVELPKRENTPVLGEKCGLSVAQVNWHLARQQVLGRTWVFVSALPFRWLVWGGLAREVNRMTRDELCVRARMWYDEKWGPNEWKRLCNILQGDWNGPIPGSRL